MNERRLAKNAGLVVVLGLGVVTGLWLKPGFRADEDRGSAPPAVREAMPPQRAVQVPRPLRPDAVVAVPLPRKVESRRVRSGVAALALSPDGALLGAAGGDKKIRLCDAATGQQCLVLQGHLGADVTSLAFSSDGAQLVSVGRDSVVRLWNTATGQQDQALQGHEQPIRSVATSRDGRFLASAGEETRVMLWEATTGKLSRILSGHTDFVNGLAFSPDGHRLASGAANGRVLLWDTASGDLMQTFLGHTGEVNAVAYSPDGRLLASASDDDRVILWDVATGRQQRALEGHARPVRSIVFSPDGGSLASAGQDGRIIVWDVVTGTQSAVLAGTPGAIDGLAFTPDGTSIISAGQDDSITVWDPIQAGERRTIRPPSAPIDARAGSSEATQGGVPTALGAAQPASSVLATLWDWFGPAAAEAQLSDPNQGPGGPILVITTASSAVGTYYAEILRAEGLNAFTDRRHLDGDAAALAGYDVMLLAARSALVRQVTTLSDWVTGGGNLVAMRPDPSLRASSGCRPPVPRCPTHTFKVDTSTRPGNGIVGETIQYHGIADRYSLSGAPASCHPVLECLERDHQPGRDPAGRGRPGGSGSLVLHSTSPARSSTPGRATRVGRQERDGFEPHPLRRPLLRRQRHDPQNGLGRPDQGRDPAGRRAAAAAGQPHPGDERSTEAAAAPILVPAARRKGRSDHDRRRPRQQRNRRPIRPVPRRE